MGKWTKKDKKTAYVLIGVALVLVVANSLFIFNSVAPEAFSSFFGPRSLTGINPNDFVENVDNRYFTLEPGTRFVYEALVEEGRERTEVYVTDEQKEVLGIKMTVVWDRVFLNGDLIEDTRDWYAQDKEGNVWYFGEDSKEVAQGKITSRAGSWEAGVDGAEPGIVMLANPTVGEVYRQEYYRGEAEDMAEIISLGETVVTPYVTLTDCLKTRDWNPLERNSDEYKYYCPEIGFVVVEESLESGERVELVSFEKNAQPSPSTLTGEELETEITEAEAREIALEEVPGEVTDVAIEVKFNKTAYVVEILAENGVETDVIIDVETGEVLAVET